MFLFCPADFDSITDPIMKAKMVALKGINKVMSQGNLGLNPMVINRYDLLTSDFSVLCERSLSQLYLKSLSVSASGSSSLQEPRVLRSPLSLHTW